MNVLAAPILFSMPSELEAFAAFSAFIERCAPLYVQPTLVGVHRGLKVSCIQPEGVEFTDEELLDRCLQVVDSELYQHLHSKHLSAEIYAFPCMSPHRLGIHLTQQPC